nr:hypothetical protein Iba_chr01dCG0510 [Ipomoea batatas]
MVAEAFRAMVAEAFSATSLGDPRPWWPRQSSTIVAFTLAKAILDHAYYYDSSSGTYGEDCASDRDNNNSNNFYQYRWLAEYKSITSDSDDDEENNLVDYPVATVPKGDEDKRGLVKEHDTIHARKRCNQYGHHRNGDGDDHTGKPDRAGAVEADGGGNILDNRRDAAATAEEDDKDSLEVVAWSHGRSCGLGLDKARLDATLFCGDGFGAWLDQMVRDLAHRDEPSLSVRPRRLAKD